MLLPYLFPLTSGLKRVGPFRWRGFDDDPQFTIRLGASRPNYIVLAADALDRPLDPCLYLDTGEGFGEDLSVAFGRSGRFLCCVDLDAMPELRGLRFDPSATASDIRFLALRTNSRSRATWLLKQLGRNRNRFGVTRVQTLTSSDLGKIDVGSGLEQRRYRSAAEHYRDVLALARDEAGSSAAPAAAPLVSFLVPTFNTKTRFLDDLLASFRLQRPGSCELVLSDDGSASAETLAWLEAHAGDPGVRVVLGRPTGGIASATNRALAEATAAWVGLVDHDDGLSPGTMDQVAAALKRRPDALFVYTDEVVADADLKPVDCFLKPAYDPVLLSGMNYVNHLSLYRTDRIRAIGGLRDGFQGSQDYDLLLRYLRDIDPGRVLHLPYPAYIWRRHATSFSIGSETVAVENARRALAVRYGNRGADAAVEPALAPALHRVRFDLARTSWPKVSVILPNKNAYDLLAQCLQGLLQGTDYPDLEIVVVDNGSTDQRVTDLYRRCGGSGRNFVADVTPEPFNFSRSINRGVRLATGDLLLLLNNDVEVIEPGWLKEMVSCFAYEAVGAVGARLLYPDRTIQHAGVIVGLGGLAGHWYGGQAEDFPGPMARLRVRQSMAAVTGAAMLVSRSCLDAVGLFDERRFAIAYNDIDFCLRAGERGYRVVWTPFATLIHHESASRGSDEVPDNIERFRREQGNLREAHGTESFADRAFNPWYTLDDSAPRLRALDRLPEAR